MTNDGSAPRLQATEKPSVSVSASMGVERARHARVHASQSYAVVGWALGLAAARYVSAWDHWIAFTLLTLLGGRMVLAGFSADDEAEHTEQPQRHGFRLLAITGLATSIDAMAVGVGLAFLDTDIVPVAAAIGLTTFLAVTAGVMLGRVLDVVAGKRAEILGGLLLIGIGTASVLST